MVASSGISSQDPAIVKGQETVKRAVFDFSGQGVVVTGGATSVGRVMAEEFLAAGAKVHTCDIDADTLQKTLQEVPGLTGSVTNVGDPEAVEALAQDTVESLGQVDIPREQCRNRRANGKD